jgi:phosphoribosyl-ATP pyrophosphohydrolase/phosphoribosyl-AMP cyclohydrolase
MDSKPEFNKLNGLVPCVVQDIDTEKVLMVAFMNEAAYEKTKTERRATFFSRGRQQLWTKGETSGHYLSVKEIILDCDRDSVLLKVTPHGPVCHTGQDTCFSESNKTQGLRFLQGIIHDRKLNPREGSYTNRLLAEGINKIAQKLGEEAVELVIEAKDNNRDRLLNEAADLMYHFLVLLAAKEVTLEEVTAVLHQRRSQ